MILQKVINEKKIFLRQNSDHSSYKNIIFVLLLKKILYFLQKGRIAIKNALEMSSRARILFYIHWQHYVDPLAKVFLD
jgi:hypothetical protein